MGPKRISVACELTEIRNALGAVRVLCDELRNDGMATTRDTLEVPRWCAAVTNLAIERLKLLSLAIYGTVDPALMVSHYNKAIAPVDEADEVELVPWSAKRRRREAIEELRRTRPKRRKKR